MTKTKAITCDVNLFTTFYNNYFVLHLTEAKTYSCFCELMKRMNSNFPHGGAMDTHFANMRSLIQVSGINKLEQDSKLVSTIQLVGEKIR